MDTLPMNAEPTTTGTSTDRPIDVTPAPRLPSATSTSLPVLLRFEEVSKWYGSVLALNQVWLPLGGGITGLVGANGAGKSTLIRLAVGLPTPSIGRVTIRGLDASDWRARSLIGYCPDHDAFYEDLSGRRFLIEMARLNGMGSKAAAERVEVVLHRVGMLDRADRGLRGYSKGMRQRIKLAQALLHDPELLVLDEPLGGVDPVGRTELIELFRQLAADGKTLLISSHELEELERLTTDVIILARGRIADRGSVADIRDRLERFPLTIRIRTPQPKRLARLLLSEEFDMLLGIELPDGDGQTLLARVQQPQQFFPRFAQLAVREQLEFESFEPLDDSAHAVLGYILGGSGKT